MAALIESGSPDNAATISAKSGDISEVSIPPCFWDSGVNWGVNSDLVEPQVFVSAGLMSSRLWFCEPGVVGSNPTVGFLLSPPSNDDDEQHSPPQWLCPR